MFSQNHLNYMRREGRLKWTGQRWAFTCRQTRLDGSHNTDRSSSSFGLARGFGHNGGNVEIPLCYYKLFFFSEENAACVRATHTNTQCARRNVIRVFVRAIFGCLYLRVLRFFVLTSVWGQKDRGVSSTSFSAKIHICSLGSLGNYLHFFAMSLDQVKDAHTHSWKDKQTSHPHRLCVTQSLWLC